jgi:hypothetical protein
MHIFALHRPSCWVACALGRNPLLRTTDRIESCAIVFAILLALAATPVCAAAGVAVYGSRARLYTEQAQARHTVAATVLETSAHTHAPHTTSIAVRAMWPVGVGVRTDWFRTNRAVKAGDRIDIWVNTAGLPATPPTPASQAGIDAVGVGAAIWFAVALGLMACIVMTRAPLDRIRHGQWEREIRSLADGGRTSRPQ